MNEVNQENPSPQRQETEEGQNTQNPTKLSNTNESMEENFYVNDPEELSEDLPMRRELPELKTTTKRVKRFV